MYEINLLLKRLNKYRRVHQPDKRTVVFNEHEFALINPSTGEIRFRCVKSACSVILLHVERRD